MNPTHFLFALFLLSSSSTLAQVNLKYMRARWHTNQGHMFNTLLIGDFNIFVDNRTDTIFWMRYEVANDTLITQHRYSNQPFKNKIILLTKDSLVLDGIGNLKEKRSYARMKIDYRSSYQMDTTERLPPNFAIGVFTGAWIPNGNSSILGIHPFVGIKLGLVRKRFEFGIVEEFRFLRSQNDYLTEYDGNVISTHHFFSAVIGGYLNYTLKNFTKSEIIAIGGLGVDELDPISKDPPQYPHVSRIIRLNKNVGFGWRVRFGCKSSCSYLGIESVYNFVDYTEGRGSQLDGNNFSIRLVYGSKLNISISNR